jgi:hypothetical protein
MNEDQAFVDRLRLLTEGLEQLVAEYRLPQAKPHLAVVPVSDEVLREIERREEGDGDG